MAAAKTSDDGQIKLQAIGPVPPPVTGMTLFTERVLRQLQRAGPVSFCNWSHSRPNVTPYAQAIRVWRSLGCMVKLMLAGRAADSRLYLVANSRSGLLLTVVFIFVARLRGYRVYLHHHTYGYINRHNRWMSWIDRRMGPGGVHIVHCDQMIEDFRRQYPSECKFATIFPSVVSIEVGRQRLAPQKPFRLGMISNLTIEKGVDLAIDVFKALRDERRQVDLDLAGPVRSAAVKDLIERTRISYPESVRYVGPVYGKAKEDFLHSIDALLFPTRYNEESWGIVLNEALAAGAPVITLNRGCTKTVVGPQAGLVVDRETDFKEAATQQIARWMNDVNEYRSASLAAIEQATYLSIEGNRLLDEFVHCFCNA
jgi:glycosyltransferase involved in cell wall biosynthesis